MNFSDNNGHIFSLESYFSKPYGYEYDNQDYIFWIDNAMQNKLSINNYYCRNINLIFTENNLKCLSNGYVDTNNDNYNALNIEIDSKIFFLVKNVNELTSKLNENLENKTFDLTNNLTNNLNLFKKNSNSDNIEDNISDDLEIYKLKENDKIYYLVRFYVVCYCDTPGTWTTNILIQNYNDWCPITVGAEFSGESEELVINGKNMGIDLPKDILKAIYQESFYNSEFNYQLYNEKLKEYLINYMSIKGEQGNFRSVENSLNWFGYKNLLSLSKLYKTDNEYKNQFIRDYFNIKNDILESYKKFRNSTFISLDAKLNSETNKSNDFNFNESNNFYGEGLPIMDDLLNKYETIEKEDSLKYIVPYYKYSFNELGMKLSCLKYFFKKYFLPIHLNIHSISLSHKVYMNDIKFINKHKNDITEYPILIGDHNNEVEFPDNNDIFFNKQIHYVDENLLEFYDKTISTDLYYINDTCASIPIKFNINDNSTKYFNCKLVLQKEKSIIDLDYYININYKFSINDYFEIYDNDKNILNLDELEFSYSFDYINQEFSPFYKGYNNILNIISNINKELVEINRDENDTLYINYKGNKYIIYNYSATYNINDDTKILIPSKEEILEDYCVYIINKFYLKIKYNKPNIYKLAIYDKTEKYILTETGENKKYSFLYINGDLIGGQDDINKYYFVSEDYNPFNSINNPDLYISFNNTDEIAYETSFSFILNSKNINNNIDVSDNFKYVKLVIYPKLMKDNNINCWLNSNYKLNLLVNNKWYKYEFKLKISTLNINLGKLNYNYWYDNNYINTPFTQLKYLSNEYNDSNIKDDVSSNIVFNSFMYNNKLSTINHSNFWTDYIKYLKLNKLQYADIDNIKGEFINNNEYYILLEREIEDEYGNKKTIKIRLNKNYFKKSFFISYKFFEKNNYNLMYIESDIIYSIFKEEDNADNYTICFDNEDIVDIPNFNDLIKSHVLLNEEIYSIFKINNLSNEYLVLFDPADINDNIIYNTIKENLLNNEYTYEYVYFVYDEENNIYNAYIIYLDENNILHMYEKPFKFMVYGTLHRNKDILLEKYINMLNIPNNDKYLNMIHLYDIYNYNYNDYISVFNPNSKYYYKQGDNKFLIESYMEDNIKDIDINYKLDLLKDLKFTQINTALNNDRLIYYYNNDNNIIYSNCFYHIEESETNNYLGYTVLSDNIDNKTVETIIKDIFENNINIIELIESNNINENLKILVKGDLNNNYFEEFGNYVYYNETTSKFNIVKPIEFNNYNQTIQFNEIHNMMFNIKIIDINSNKEFIPTNYNFNKILENIKARHNYTIKIEFYIYNFNRVNNEIQYFNNNDTEFNDEIKNIAIYINNNILTINSLSNIKLALNINDLKQNKNYLINKNQIKLKLNLLYNNEINNINIKYWFDKDKNNIFIAQHGDEILIDTDKYNTIKFKLETNDLIFNNDDILSFYFNIYNYSQFKYDVKDNENNKNIIEIDIDNKTYYYNDNSTKEIYDLYKQFFQTLELGNNLSTVINNDSINLNSYLDYDFYLMHDDKYWYGLYISKETIDKVRNMYDLKISEEDKTKYLLDNLGNTLYDLKYVKSSKETLINRFKLEETNGINHFSDNDIIVAYVNNNDRIPVNIFMGYKWDITPLSIGIPNTATCVSNNEMCIFNIDKTNSKYYKGYYTISVRYCLDNIVEHQFKNDINLLIK